jgi:plastocyanin
MRTSLLALLTSVLLIGCEAQIDDSVPPALPTASPVVQPAEPPPAVEPPPAEPPPATPPPAEPPPVTPPPATPPPATPPPATPPPATGSLQITLPSTSLTLHLNETKTVTATVTPTNGFNGTATFAVTGLPSGVTASFNPASVSMTTAPVQVTLSLHSVSEMVGSLGVPLTITTSAGSISSSTPLTLDVLQEVLITIAKGVNLGTSAQPNTSAFGAVTTSVMFVAPGTKVTFINMDTRAHEIHANNNPTGLQHEPGQLQPNGTNTYSQILKAGTVNFRCHIHPNMLGQIVVR